MGLTARVYSGRELLHGELHPLAAGLAAVFTARSPDGDALNEDSCALIPYSDVAGVAVVADGAGGLPSGERASELAVSAMRSALRAASRRGGELRSAILDGIEKANRAVLGLGIGAATTLAVAEFQGSRVRTYHVGDSQIIVVGQRGKVKLQTMSHSPVGYAVGSGMMAEREALRHAERHLVSNLIGLPGMHIEVGTAIELSAKDTVIIASDGLFDNLRTAEIVETCRKGQLLALSRELVETCHRRMLAGGDSHPSKPDDLTFIAYRRRATA